MHHHPMDSPLHESWVAYDRSYLQHQSVPVVYDCRIVEFAAIGAKSGQGRKRRFHVLLALLGVRSVRRLDAPSIVVTGATCRDMIAKSVILSQIFRSRSAPYVASWGHPQRLRLFLSPILGRSRSPGLLHRREYLHRSECQSSDRTLLLNATDSGTAGAGPFSAIACRTSAEIATVALSKVSVSPGRSP